MIRIEATRSIAQARGWLFHFPKVTNNMKKDEIALTTTCVRLPTQLHRVLREAALGRRRAAGDKGRSSQGNIIAELIEKHREELTADAKRELPPE